MRSKKNKGGNWFGRHTLLTAAGITAVLAGVITVVHVKYVDPWLMYRAVAKRTDRSVDEVAKYCLAMGLDSHCRGLDDLIKEMNLSTFKILSEDQEIIQRAEKEEDVCSEHGVSHVIDDIMDGFIYNSYTGKKYMVKPSSYGGLQSIEDYLTLTPEQRKLGFFTIMEGKQCGLTIDDLSKMGKVSEGYFSILVTAKVPGSYAAPLLRQGTKPEEIVEKYATEEVKVPSNVLLEYRILEISQYLSLSNHEINIAHSTGMKPEYIDEAIIGESSKRMLFDLIEEGKLTGEIWKQWTDRGIWGGDILYALDKNYELRDVLEADFLDINFEDMDNELRRYELFKRIEERNAAQ